MMSKINITEIFRSIQGEGKYLGESQLFVRLAGCNLSCAYCDTNTPEKDGVVYDTDSLLDKISGLYDGGLHSVSITGGEPLLQADGLRELLPRLKGKSIKIYLETNGILCRELESIIEYVDIVSMDIKLVSSTGERAFWAEHTEFLKVARTKDVFVKAVITDETIAEDIIVAGELVSGIDKNVCFVLQPDSFGEEGKIKAKCAAFKKILGQRLEDVRIIPQMHKVLNIR